MSNSLKNICRSLLCVICIAINCLWLSCADTKKTKEDVYKVLIIESYRSDLFWTENIEKGIKKSFSDHKIEAGFTTIHLDSEITNKEEQQDAINAFLDEYRLPDLILVYGDQATHSLLTSAHSATYTVPIVFYGVDYYNSNWLDNRKNVTGITTAPDYKKTFELIQSIYPQMQGIVLDIDDNPLSQLAVEEFKRQIKDIDIPDSIHIQIHNLDQSLGSSSMWSATFVNQYPHIMPVWSSFYGSRARDTEVPFFCVNNKGLGQGFLGGYMSKSYDQAYGMASIGIQILQGKPIDEIAITAAPKELIFDWNQMKKSGIKESQLPEGSIIVNQSYFEKHGKLFVGLIVIGLLCIVGFTAGIIYLYKQAREKKKKAQFRLSGHRSRLKIVMSSIREGVISIDRNMNIFTINPAALQWLKLPGDDTDYIGKNILSVIDITQQQKHIQFSRLLKAVYTDNCSIPFESAHIHSKINKYSIPISGAISSIQQQGNLYGAVIIFNDVSEELAQKEFLALTLDAGDVCVWRFDYMSKTIIFDQTFFTLYGIEDNDTHSISLDTLMTYVHPDDRQQWMYVNHQLIAGEVNTLMLEIRVDVNGKGYQWWELRYTCLHPYSEGGKPFIFGLVRNVQDFKQTLSDIEQARDKAQLSDRLKSAFLANMSHEIRTPLNAIVGFSNVLTSGEDFEPEERQIFIETIRNNCNLLLALISDVLDMAQIETGNMLFKEEVCDVNEFISQIVITQRVIIPEHLSIIRKIPEETVYIITDKLRLNQVITNLINNAVKFTEKGSVTVGYSMDNEEFLHFFVEDTGKGMPETDLIHIFERFFKKDDFKQGAGLGLSICKMIVDRFEGTINVTSKVGEGSRFTVTIPYRKATSLTEEKNIFTQSNIYKLYNMNTATEDATLNDKPTLLIAEDEESNYLLLKTILQKHCNLIRAKTGKEALEKFQENNTVDLIMLDIKMPEMTGIQALKEIRKISTTIPIIMQSAYVFDSDMEEARQAGATDFITKPINIKILKETLSAHCPNIQW